MSKLLKIKSSETLTADFSCAGKTKEELTQYLHTYITDTEPGEQFAEVLKFIATAIEEGADIHMLDNHGYNILDWSIANNLQDVTTIILNSLTNDPHTSHGLEASFSTLSHTRHLIAGMVSLEIFKTVDQAINKVLDRQNKLAPPTP